VLAIQVLRHVRRPLAEIQHEGVAITSA
jgi:hypothetical protein